MKEVIEAIKADVKTIGHFVKDPYQGPIVKAWKAKLKELSVDIVSI